MIPSAHLDTFARDNLPPRAQWPDFLFDLPELAYPERMNCVVELLDRWLAAGAGDPPCLISAAETLSYAQLAERVNRIANVLTRDLGVLPGHRVLLRGPNSAMMVAAYLAVIKAGGVVIATMPLLRAKEIAFPIAKAKIKLALCDHRLADEMEKARQQADGLARVVYWGSGGGDALEAMMRGRGYEQFVACDTASDDVCLVGFTSGTTGEPKGTMHFHRDLLATCDSYGRHVLRAQATDRFIGSPPLAFTFGLGGLVLFPLRIGASTILPDKTTPDDLLAAIEQVQGDHLLHRADRLSRDAGEARRARRLVAAQMRVRRRSLAEGHVRRLARGHRPRDPRRHRRDRDAAHLHRLARATKSVRAPPAGRCRATKPAWSMPTARSCRRTRSAASPCAGRPAAAISPMRASGNMCRTAGTSPATPISWMRDGYFWYQARSDDMIVSAGYNIAGPEVEAALLAHPAVAECGVVGAPDEERGQIVKAYVVLHPGHIGEEATTKLLQEHVKAIIAPYKYPRAIAYVTALPRTQTGKLQRFELRRMAGESAELAS